jgi:hypothetical protein
VASGSDKILNKAFMPNFATLNLKVQSKISPAGLVFFVGLELFVKRKYLKKVA